MERVDGVAVDAAKIEHRSPASMGFLTWLKKVFRPPRAKRIAVRAPKPAATEGHAGYVYLIQEREFIKTGEKIYKFGRTSRQPNARLAHYPKGSHLLLTLAVRDNERVEREILARFATEFKLRADIGREYFEGCPMQMVRTIMQLALEEMDIT